MKRGPLIKTSAALLLGLTIVGCVTMERTAPLVDARLIDHAPAPRAPTAQLLAGRNTYLNQCATCHVLEPIDNYTNEQWQLILPAMNQEAKLDEQESDNVTAYVMAAHAMLMRDAQ